MRQLHLHVLRFLEFVIKVKLHALQPTFFGRSLRCNQLPSDECRQRQRDIGISLISTLNTMLRYIRTLTDVAGIECGNYGLTFNPHEGVSEAQITLVLCLTKLGFSPIGLTITGIASNGRRHASCHKSAYVFASACVISKVEESGKREALDTGVEIQLEDRIQNAKLRSKLPRAIDYAEAIGEGGGTESVGSTLSRGRSLRSESVPIGLVLRDGVGIFIIVVSDISRCLHSRPEVPTSLYLLAEDSRVQSATDFK